MTPATHVACPQCGCLWWKREEHFAIPLRPETMQQPPELLVAIASGQPSPWVPVSSNWLNIYVCITCGFPAEKAKDKNA